MELKAKVLTIVVIMAFWVSSGVGLASDNDQPLEILLPEITTKISPGINGPGPGGAAIESEEEAQGQESPAVLIEVGNTICPVHKKEIATPSPSQYTYKGKIYNFCFPECIEEFKKDPEKYVKIIEEITNEGQRSLHEDDHSNPRIEE